MRKKLEELNLLDDFLFGTMISHPVYGVRFAKILLKIILNRDVEILKIVSQMNYYGQDTDCHGARLDVYLEEYQASAQGTIGAAGIYDIEPDQSSGYAERAALPRRVRFYRSVIDAKNLQSGKDYSRLKNVIIIMLAPYDPFGYDRMVYTVRNQCLEAPEMEYEDGALNLFLYTKGNPGKASQELRDLLHYLEHTTWDNTVNMALKEIQMMVDEVKHNREVSVSYMKIYERERMIRNEGIARGRIDGIAQGRAYGFAESIKELLSEHGTFPEDMEKQIDEEKDIEVLSRWVRLAAKVSSMEEFAERMNVNGKCASGQRCGA